jgi:hypothetical protein
VKLIAAALAMLATANAAAYEFESAVPLKLETLADTPRLSDISIRLDGKKVSLAATIRNESASTARKGFVAYTPFSRQLGEGEENSDKRFSDLRVSLDGRPTRLKARHLRDFPGLARVTYSWVSAIPPASTARLAIQYQALPQFSLEQVSSERYSRLVQQHCGDSASVTAQLKASAPAIEYVLMERYSIPASFIDRESVKLQVNQPGTNWAGAHPRLSLVCGYTSKATEALSKSGTIEDADADLSILIISRLASP